MKLNLVLMTVLILTLYGSQASCSDFCNPNIDAFEYLKNNKINIIKYSTFKSPDICASLNQTEIDDVTKAVTFVFTSFNTEAGMTGTQIFINKVGNCSNEVQVFDENGVFGFDRYLLYGDANCGIFQFTIPESFCTMFIPPDATEQNIQDCLGRYDEKCGTTKYDVYPSSCYGTA